MTDMTMTREAIQCAYGDRTYRDQVVHMLADARARWPERGLTAMTTGWMDDPSIDSIIFVGSPNVIVSLVARSESPAHAMRADIRRLCKQAAERHGRWLSDNALGVMRRPDRPTLRIDTCSGRRRYDRTQPGYDWLELLSKSDVRRLSKRWVDGGPQSPDVVAHHARTLMGTDWTDCEAIGWLLEQWALEDGLRSVANGRLPHYVNAESMMPAEYADHGYSLELLFSDFAEQHIAEVEADRPDVCVSAPLGEYTAAF